MVGVGSGGAHRSARPSAGSAADPPEGKGAPGGTGSGRNEGADPLPVVAAVLRDGRGRVLLARRLPGGPHGGLWEFPGGKVEEGEAPEEALARELLEELGVGVAVGEEVACVDHAYPHLHIRLTAYFCTLVSGDPVPLHCQEVAWVEPAELLSRPMPEADRPIARRLVCRGACGDPFGVPGPGGTLLTV